MPKFNVEKSILIQAPVQQVYATVRDFHTWPTWSPWLIAEPGCEAKVSPDGMQNSWEGDIVGSGKMIIDSAEENKAIHYTLTFLKPWKAVSPVSFLFEESQEGVKVTWTMEGSMPFFLFFMTKMMGAVVGMDYERGLGMLKDYVESGSVPSALDFPGVETVPGCTYVGIRTECGIQDIGEAMSADFENLAELLGREALVHSFSIYHKWDMVKGACEYTAGCAVDAPPEVLPQGMFTAEFPSCDAYKVVHTGPYRHLANAWSAGMMHGRAKVYKQNKKNHPFETYGNDPGSTPENELITNVYFPVA